MKQLILNNVKDMVSDFLYYDRKEDEDLPQGAIELAIKNGDIKITDIIEEFTKQLCDGIK